MRKLRINHGKTFTVPIRLLSFLLTSAGIYYCLIYLKEPISIPLAIVISMIAPAIWFSTRIVEVDIEYSTLFKGNFFLGRKIGEKTSFKEINNLLIKKTKTKPTTYTLTNNKIIRTDYEFKVYLVTDKTIEFFLVSHPIKETTLKKAEKIRRKLGLAPEAVILQ